ncbi:MAG: pyridoxamine 5'-phosphate oxidase family protein [Chloroflexota bacterium]|nr:pyridoxamine 5'-phosphate oxidase family protein [Chloroflexota bacterium]
MSRDTSQLPPTHMRRSDRAVEDDAWIGSFLSEAPFGILATERDGQPFVNSNLFVYDGASRCIYIHTARTGRTRDNIEANNRVCFHVAAMGRLLPADVALEFSVEYEGVTLFGRATIIADRDEASYGLQHLLDKYFPHLKPGRDYRPIIEEELSRTTVIRIDIEGITGKRKAADTGFPGAFLFGEMAG